MVIIIIIIIIIITLPNEQNLEEKNVDTTLEIIGPVRLTRYLRRECANYLY